MIFMYDFLRGGNENGRMVFARFYDQSIHGEYVYLSSMRDVRKYVACLSASHKCRWAAILYSQLTEVVIAAYWNHCRDLIILIWLEIS